MPLHSVGDALPGGVVAEDPSMTMERGRGLGILDAVADDWGVTPTVNGKLGVVRAVLPNAYRGPSRTERAEA